MKSLLVSMPWPTVYYPSIQIGLLKAAATERGIDVQTRSYYLDFAQLIVEATASDPEPLAVTDYAAVSESGWQVALGDWIFSVEPYRSNTIEDDASYEAFAKLGSSFAKAKRMRDLVPVFLERCADDVLASGSTVIGFTSTFNQNVPSIALAMVLKRRNPEICIIFGGANCDGPMGPALHRSFDCIDYVVSGEGETVFPDLLESIAAGLRPVTIPGVTYREAGVSVTVPRDPGRQLPMDEIPSPDYGEYFARLKRSSIRPLIDGSVSLLIESSRGCWWGEKHHCTFCGLNGTSMAFRSKSPERVAQEIYHLSRTYNRTQFQPVDNILDLKYFKSLLPILGKARAAGSNFLFFYETKANLKKEQVELLFDAGVHAIQPGIESLSTPILKLMNKGVSALHNIRLLKWAREYGVRVVWNLIYGFPREPLAEYDRMIDLMPSLVHLDPPGLAPLLMERFSPYFDAPEQYGIRLDGPAEFYRYIYDLPPTTLVEIAYEFKHSMLEGDAYTDESKALYAAVGSWRTMHRASRLSYSRGPGHLTIHDHRAGLDRRELTLTGFSAEAYAACDAGASIAEICAAFRDRSRDAPDEAAIAGLFAALSQMRLLYEENGTYLALAVADRPVNSFSDPLGDYVRNLERGALVAS